MARTPLPRVSVVVAAKSPPPTLARCLDSLAGAHAEVLVADGSDEGALAEAVRSRAGMRHLAIPGAALPALKAAAIRAARGGIVAILDPTDAAEPGWIDEILAAFEDASVAAVGGAVLLEDAAGRGNAAAYLFEYGAFNPPFEAGDAPGDLPGNNVAYRREALGVTCADLLDAEGFYKPLFHERIRAHGGRLVLRPSLRVRHLTAHRFLDFGVRRFHYGRCFGATRTRRAPLARRLLYRALAPAIVPLLVARHVRRAWAHPANRRLLARSAPALCGVCAFWGIGEWIGCWFGPGDSCARVH